MPHVRMRRIGAPVNPMHQHRRMLIVLLALWLPGVGCSIKKLAVNKVGDALSEGGSTFASDDDPELIEAALPFSLKLMESLLAASPRHEGLLEALTSGFTQYAYAFVQQKAEELEDYDLDAATIQRDRTRRLYLRARNYGLRGLNLSSRILRKRCAWIHSLPWRLPMSRMCSCCTGRPCPGRRRSPFPRTTRILSATCRSSTR